jgi:gamma-glutamyltranspeptidase/glutathione hydrolase
MRRQRRALNLTRTRSGEATKPLACPASGRHIPRVTNVQNWIVRKPAARSRGGIVVSQNQRAAEIGARVLADGGNAVDAAVATGFALAALEPWNSGLGGIGFMVIWQARERRAHVVDFGPVSARRLDPSAFPLVEGAIGGDLFGWPRVAEDRNVHGPLSIAVPGHVDGLGLAHERFGSLPWDAVLAPAIEQAERGMPVDWFATLRVAMTARELARYPTTVPGWLPGGLPPVTPPGAEPARVRAPNLAETIRRLAVAGRRDFYEGAIAQKLAADLERLGSPLRADDLAAYRARLVEPLAFEHGGARVFTSGGLTAGPTLAKALSIVARANLRGTAPGPEAYAAYADGLSAAYEERFATMGDVREPETACTTHLNVVDADGNAVALTQTLLSLFGSKMLMPETGILMNNGNMWFDPRPGGPNAIGAAKRPLSNMCPAVATRDGAPWLAIGASGGRKIVGAVAQLISFMTDFGMDLESAAHQPRIDVSGEAAVRVDTRLDDAVADALAKHHPVRRAEHTVLPVAYACPCAIRIEPDGERVGITDVMTPGSGAAVA